VAVAGQVSGNYAPARVDVFVYSHDAADTGLRGDEELLERHWTYMDRFAASMIARGPTLAADRETATGSLHVLGLPSVESVRAFVAHEPNNRAGVYASHDIWRFENLLGRTMWAFTGAAGEPRWLIIARSDRNRAGPSSRPIPYESLPPELRERLILYGALSTLDDAEPVGVALAVEAPDRDAVAALLGDGRSAFEVPIFRSTVSGVSPSRFATSRVAPREKRPARPRRRPRPLNTSIPSGP
jgi:uncharacterized protein YciI